MILWLPCLVSRMQNWQRLLPEKSQLLVMAVEPFQLEALFQLHLVITYLLT